jgi:hypothetical protein
VYCRRRLRRLRRATSSFSWKLVGLVYDLAAFRVTQRVLQLLFGQRGALFCVWRLNSFAVDDEAGAGFEVGAVLGTLLLLGGERENGFVEDDLVDVALEVVDA